MKNLYCTCLIAFFFSFSMAAQSLKQESFYFKTDRFDLSKIEESKIDSTILPELSKSDSIFIYGYCDDRGRKSYNDTLSQKRSKTVKDKLSSGGIPKNKIISVQGKGEISLTGSRPVDVQRSNNRRVDIFYSSNSNPKAIETTEIKAQELFSDTVKIGDKIVLENILFEGGRSVLLEESLPALDNLVKTLKARSTISVMILGHVCCRWDGEDGVDWDTGRSDLSTARAKKIYDYLIDHGIDKNRLSFKGMKSKFKTGLGDKYDRRVEAEVTGM